MGAMKSAARALMWPGIQNVRVRVFAADALEVMLDSEWAQHPDYHDGWCAVRARRVCEDEPASDGKKGLVLRRVLARGRIVVQSS